MAGEIHAGPEVVSKSGPGAAVKPTPVAALAPQVDPSAELKAKQDAFEHSMRLKEVKLNREAQKFKSERETEKKTWGEKLSQVERFEKLKANAKLNPEPLLKEVLGDKYYELITEHRLNGGAPPAQIVAAEIEKIREEMNGKLSERDEALRKEREERAAEAKKAGESAQAQQVVGYISDFWTKNVGDYPAIEAEGHPPEKIAAMIAAEVRREFDATSEVDEEGNVVKPGKADPKGVADRWEASLLFRAKRISALPKYAAAVPKSEAQPQRRTLSNDLTGSTAAEKPTAMTPEQLRLKALEARQKYIDGKATR